MGHKADIALHLLFLAELRDTKVGGACTAWSVSQDTCSLPQPAEIHSPVPPGFLPFSLQS